MLLPHGSLLFLLCGPWLLNGIEDCKHHSIAVDPPEPLPGEDQASSNYTRLVEGTPILDHLSLNKSKLYWYENFNVTTMNQPDRYRKLMISLEPCEGIVYLFVRKTRPCWPNPHSCCQPSGSVESIDTVAAPPCAPPHQKIKCDWTHFHSIIDGTKDAAPTFFEVPLTSTKYYIAVFAPQEANVKAGVVRARFRLTMLADIGAYPRPGLQGRLKAKQVGEMSVELQWEQATFMPVGVSDLKNYHIYSSLLLPNEEKTSDAVFLKPSKIMNSVCGLETNAMKYGVPLTDKHCHNGKCSAVVSGVLPKKRYMFNIVSESMRNFNSTYSGIIVDSDWKETTKLFGESADTVVHLVAAVCGTILGVVIMGYLWIVKLYN